MTTKKDGQRKPSSAGRAPLALDDLDLALQGMDMVSVARGTGALDGVGTPAAVSDGKPLQLPIDDVIEDPKQPRQLFDERLLDELADSIRAGGIRSPLSVQPAAEGRYIVNHGARRLRAARLAGLATVPAFIDDTHDDYDQMVENIQRDDLKPMEVARWIRAKVDSGVKHSEIARRLGKGKSWISRYVGVSEAPGWVVEAADAGKIGDVNTLYQLQLYMADHPEDAEPLQAEVESLEKFSRADLQRFIDARKPRPANGGEEGSDAENLKVSHEKLSDGGAGEGSADDYQLSSGFDVGGQTPRAVSFSGSDAGLDQPTGLRVLRLSSDMEPQALRDRLDEMSIEGSRFIVEYD